VGLILLVGFLFVGFLVGRVRRRDVGLILCLAARRTSCERPTERPMTRAAVTRITAPPIFKSFVRKTIVESPLMFYLCLVQTRKYFSKSGESSSFSCRHF